MSIRWNRRARIVLVAALALLVASGLFYTTKTFSYENPQGIDYFKGQWTVALRNNPKASFRWTVREELRGGWLMGVVEQNGQKVSTDFWRQSSKRIERFAFTADGTFVRIESPGWESNRLVFTGVASDKTGETKVRETITPVGDRQFNALWERETADGKWVTFSDEICTK
jgi:hypothetical protein